MPKAPKLSFAAKSSPTAKGRVFVNNQPATVQVLKLLAPELALVTRRPKASPASTSRSNACFSTVSPVFPWMQSPRPTLAGILPQTNWTTSFRENKTACAVDLWSYQKKEIEQAHLENGEDEALETEKRVLANAEKLYAAAMSAFRRALRRQHQRRSRTSRRRP